MASGLHLDSDSDQHLPQQLELRSVFCGKTAELRIVFAVLQSMR